MSKIRTSEILSKLPLFNEMGPDNIEYIAKSVQEIHAEKGQVLFRAGEMALGFHVVVFGQVKLAFTSAKGVEKVVQLFGAGQSFGEALMFLEKPYPLSAITLSDSLLLHIPKSAVENGISQDKQFAHKMLAGLSMRLHGLIHDVEAYSLRSSAQRVIGYLLQHEDLDTAPTLHLSVSKNVIASRLNITPETLSRILHDLVSANLIRVEGKDVTILNVEKLRAYG
ncbi:Crp/Fnr family transcriptional regulator [Sulfurirhabdus autotrophica]|uniref:CRP-like cAMP-binding protein n=1 Tax=Sulfurirhabdus autotrophica TaxID=1706046 RepID=A0A4R3XWP8_9PROT|nr:Crp/Fnr family transcriptional regulator [Sulfurirhabdus autotrophica]TCV83261.1 CRP-like cAMP-binding protein [Sulfurirhabdus autotrophica]